MDLIRLYNEAVTEKASLPLRILRDQSPKVLAIMPRGTGKTELLIEKALGLRGHVAIIVPNREAADIIFNKIASKINMNNVLSIRSRQKRIDTNGGGFILVACSQFQLTGLSVDHILVDEPDYLDNYAKEFLSSYMRGATFFVIGTPISEDSWMRSLAETGEFTVYDGDMNGEETLA